MIGHDPHTTSSLEEFFLQIPHLQIDQSNLELTVQSHHAFMASSIEDHEQDRAARALNGEVVSESEPVCVAGVSTVNSEEGRSLVKKRRMAIRRKAARWHAN